MICVMDLCSSVVPALFKGRVELFSSCRNHRTGAGGAQEGPAAEGRTGRTGRTRN